MMAIGMAAMTVLCSGVLTAQDAAVVEVPDEIKKIQEAASASARPPSTGDYPLNEKVLEQVTYDIKYMSSDEMGGRQPGTPGIKLCEDYIVAEYKKAGLKPLEDGTYFQEMEVGNKRLVNKEATALSLHGPNDAELKLELGEDFQQLICRRDFDLDADVVFVGYGISADEHNYDDFDGIDVEDKIVVLIRFEPQGEDPNSVFDGADTSRHASGSQKVTAARRAGAAGILMVNDAASAGDTDDFVQPDRFQTNSLPFAQIRRSVLDEVLESSPLTAPTGKKLESVSDIEELIDSNLEPISQPLEGWTAKFASKFDREATKTNNIIGIIEGEGPNADETIIIGAHYDHLGMGAYGSRAGGRKEIHNGADDNATGTAAVIELARRFGAKDKKPGRRMVFICFTAEEMGLLGAFHYCQNPIFPLENTVSMINFDMIGWLRNNEVTLYSINSSEALGKVFDEANEGFDFKLKKARGGGSDQIPFNQRKIPNVFVHTGQTAVYHTPEDDFETIDCKGALKVIDYTEAALDRLVALESKPTYGAPARSAPFRLGVMLNDDDGVVTIEGVTEESVAESAGLQKGDVVMEVDGKPMTKRREFSRIIRRDAGKTVQLKLKRGDAEVMLNIDLKKSK